MEQNEPRQCAGPQPSKEADLYRNVCICCCWVFFFTSWRLFVVSVCKVKRDGEAQRAVVRLRRCAGGVSSALLPPALLYRRNVTDPSCVRGLFQYFGDAFAH